MVSIVKRRPASKFDSKRLETRRIDGKKLLKSCVRCRHNKTKCDALQTSPYPCSYCSKKRFVCVFDTLKPSNRSYDLFERLVAEVSVLHRKLDAIVDKKTLLLRALASGPLALSSSSLSSRLSTPDSSAFSPAPSELVKSTLQPSSSPADVDSASSANAASLTGFIDPIPTLSLSDSFVINANLALEPCTVSVAEATELFANFKENFCCYLPILPSLFFHSSLHHIHAQSDLLFWSIIVTAMLNSPNHSRYALLAKHIHNLVVVSCWFNTPRSLYSLVALMILTTWPLPEEPTSNVQNNISVKYISLMKNLALQFGLHKLTFLDEFSKKTDMSLLLRPESTETADPNDPSINTIRERIYKFVTINSNYWLVFLGLSNSNYNGFHQDYIINKSANIDIFNKDDFHPTDNFINSFLKVSLVQLKMNESMNDLLESPNNVSKLIHLNLFERILDNYSRPDSPLLKHDLVPLSLEYSKLQLYIYYFSAADLSLGEYQSVVYRAVAACKRTLDLFSVHFSSISNINQVPIHYRFGVELAALILLHIHSSPLLRSVEDYIDVKYNFLRAYRFLSTCPDPKVSALNKLFMIITKYDQCDRRLMLTLASLSGSFLLIKKMGNYLISGLHYEMIWRVYRAQTDSKVNDPSSSPDWSVYGLDPANNNHKCIIDYVSLGQSIFS